MAIAYHPQGQIVATGSWNDAMVRIGCVNVEAVGLPASRSIVWGFEFSVL